MFFFNDSKIESYFELDVPVFICGLVPHLQLQFIDYVREKFKANFVYSKRNNSDIQKYLNSLEYIDLGENKYSLSGLELTLEGNEFERVTKVSSRGEWSKKGDLISFWPIEYEHPIRVSYFDEEIEFIEIFDEIYGTKIERIEAFVLGNLKKLEDKVDWYEISVSGNVDLRAGLIIIFSQYDLDVNSIFESNSDEYVYHKAQRKNVINFDFTFPTLFYKRFDLLEKELERLEGNGWKIVIATRHENELSIKLNKYLISSKRNSVGVKKDNVKGISEEIRKLLLDPLPAGFGSESNKFLYLTDRELFGTIFLENERKNLSTKQAKKILEQLEGEIEIGDYVVHEDHGVGVYRGMHQEIRKEEVMINFERKIVEHLNDYLLIEYAEGDELLIPISQIQKITKYIGTTNELPIITRLHKGNWKGIIQKTKKSIKLIARELVEHYARVHLANTQRIDFEDSEFYNDFVRKFPYEETPDQLTAIQDIKKDLAQDKPMDRLIVGDVGFGKTEVAMRAAFKVIEQGEQVAVLCPTTVLAVQHYKVFRDRFSDFGIEVEYVSRFNSPTENRNMIQKAKEGKIDILVGTHRLLSSDVEFKKLGLIVIDEEQKFGVKQKEKIKKIQYSAHSLTMTATPIPRTLSMALSQIREISIITTPPVGRKSVKTVVEKLDWNKIAMQIDFEVKRGGQVYFLHNKVDTIESIKNKLEKLLPGVRYVVGHGKQSPKVLDTVISDFYEKKHDVLVCTTIIENGIDMPNVNTIIINDGQNFGLGQLYQLRGRVGRSDKQAYCYVYYKGDSLQDTENIGLNSVSAIDITEKTNKKNVEKKYIQRLKAILESQELGSGFKLASRDLEIRGAGNLLGKQQHGNIKNVGLALYMQMLAEEIERLKNINID